MCVPVRGVCVCVVMSICDCVCRVVWGWAGNSVWVGVLSGWKFSKYLCLKQNNHFLTRK